MTQIAIIAIIPLYLAVASRMAGDAKLKWYGVFLYSVPYTVLIGYNLYVLGNNIGNNIYVLSTPLGSISVDLSMLSVFCAASVTFAWVFLWKITGHADGFFNYVRDNTLSPVVGLIAKIVGVKRNTKQYDAIFWAIKGGIIVAIPAVIYAYVTGSYIPAIGIFCASFFGYPLAYWLGFHVLNKRRGLVNTAWGELLAGFFSGLGFLTLL